MSQLSAVWKIAITLVVFLVAIMIASFALEFFLGHPYPAWTIIAALVLMSPVVYLLWPDRFK
jgi:hypothetical protein